MEARNKVLAKKPVGGLEEELPGRNAVRQVKGRWWLGIRVAVVAGGEALGCAFQVWKGNWPVWLEGVP